MSRRASRRLRRRREEQVRKLARSGAWYRGPHEEQGPGWRSVGGGLPFHGPIPRVLILAVGDGPHNHRVRLADVLRLDRALWRFLWAPKAPGSYESWPFRCEWVSFFDNSGAPLEGHGAPELPTAEGPPLEADGGASMPFDRSGSFVEAVPRTSEARPSVEGADPRRVGEETPS